MFTTVIAPTVVTAANQRYSRKKETILRREEDAIYQPQAIPMTTKDATMLSESKGVL